MNNNLLFDFTVDKTANTVFVNREFSTEPFFGLERIH
jgi:hypothetical protein